MTFNHLRFSFFKDIPKIPQSEQIDCIEHFLQDVEAVAPNLLKQHFNQLVHNDPTRGRIQEIIKAFIELPEKIARIVIVMSHGGQNNTLEDRDGFSYDYYKTIADQFNCNNAPHLEESLKLIIINACR